MIPRKRSAPLSAAGPEVGDNVPPEMIAAAAKKVQLTVYVSSKNLRRDRMIASTRVGYLAHALPE
jgi:hypothetical protein